MCDDFTLKVADFGFTLDNSQYKLGALRYWVGT